MLSTFNIFNITLSITLTFLNPFTIIIFKCVHISILSNTAKKLSYSSPKYTELTVYRTLAV